MQFAGAKASWLVDRVFVALSENLAIDVPILTKKEISLLEILRDRGASDEAIAIVQGAMNFIFDSLEG